MAIREFSIADLSEIDSGRIGEALKLELKRILDDCRDRPTLDKARKIKLQIDVKPTADPKTFALDGINVDFRINSTFPNRERSSLNFGVKADGRIFYSDQSPENFDQATIFDSE